MKPRSTPTILVVDNYDSFTHNLVHQIAKVGIPEASIVVIRNDEKTIADVEAMNPDAIIIGPGPGHPENAKDIGMSREIITYAERTRTALLGVCLGHQLLGSYYGGTIARAEEPMHGKVSSVHPTHPDVHHEDLFGEFENDIPMMRYHSLEVRNTEEMQRSLAITAVVRDQIMGLQHSELPMYGIQAHPESFATPQGNDIMQKFLSVALGKTRLERLRAQTKKHRAHMEEPMQIPLAVKAAMEAAKQKEFREFPFQCELPPEEVYMRLHNGSKNCFCFESLTDAGEPLSYFGAEPSFVLRGHDAQLLLDDEAVSDDFRSPFDVMSACMEQMRGSALGTPERNDQRFSGGFSGFLSYEAMQYLEPAAFAARAQGSNDTFAFGYFPDGLTYDRQTKKYTYFTRGEDRSSLFTEMLKKSSGQKDPTIRPLHQSTSKGIYIEDAEKIQRKHILTGDAFQVVLSRSENYHINGSLAPLYKDLRKTAPSRNMHAIKMGGVESIGSFPELALSILNNRIAQVYALAGTVRRSGNESVDDDAFAELRSDIKECAEHAMLVDLSRNDMTRISRLGTVILPKGRLMHRQDAASVIHMASLIQGELKEGMPLLKALLTVTPMGTVSGAPKIRAAEIIHRYEDSYSAYDKGRFLYGGSIGFIDNLGNAEFVAGLRSIIRDGARLKIQAGAGIVHDSVPEKEYEETVMKLAMQKRILTPYLEA